MGLVEIYRNTNQTSSPLLVFSLFASIISPHPVFDIIVDDEVEFFVSKAIVLGKDAIGLLRDQWGSGQVRIRVIVENWAREQEVDDRDRSQDNNDVYLDTTASTVTRILLRSNSQPYSIPSIESWLLLFLRVVFPRCLGVLVRSRSARIRSSNTAAGSSPKILGDEFSSEGFGKYGSKFPICC